MAGSLAALLCLALAAGLWAALGRGGEDDRRLRLVVPAYGHPLVTPVWRSLGALPAGSAVVVNPANGPGERAERAYAEAIGPVRAAGVELLGYVDTGYGGRDAAVMQEEVARHVAWYAVDGIFLDQTVARGAALDVVADLVARLREDGLTVVVNPGQPDLDPRYGELDATVVDFEGDPVGYRAAAFPSPASAEGGARSLHLVYGVATEEEMAGIVDTARRRGADAVYVTDGLLPNPWSVVPPYLPAEAGRAERP